MFLILAYDYDHEKNEIGQFSHPFGVFRTRNGAELQSCLDHDAGYLYCHQLFDMRSGISYDESMYDSGEWITGPLAKDGVTKFVTPIYKDQN